MSKKNSLPESHPKKRRQASAQLAWISAFKKSGTILGACNATGIDRKVVRDWRRDAKFSEMFDGADEDITETLETAALQNALTPAGVVDRIFLLKSRRPEKYRDNLNLKHQFPDELFKWLAER